MNSSEPRRKFYSDGLKFSCTRCSCCCRFDSGYVWLSRNDLNRLSLGLAMPVKAVVDRYCHTVDIGGFHQLSLNEQDNFDCVFWKEGRCSVYEHRPLQCRAFPFWGPYLSSREDWDRLEASCPGVNIGRVHTAAEIDQRVEERRWEPPLNAETL